MLRLALQTPGEAEPLDWTDSDSELSLQEFLAEGEETPSERRARLAREAEQKNNEAIALEQRARRLQQEEEAARKDRGF